MHIRRFVGPTLLEAVRKVKEELGPDALVLSTRSVRVARGRFGLLARTAVEVTAAVDRDHHPAASGRGEVRRTGEDGAAGAARPERVGPDPSWRELVIGRALVEPLQAEIRELRRSVERLSGDRLDEDLLGEIRALRRLRLDADAARSGDRLAGRLVAAGLAGRHARSLAAEIAAGPEEDAPRLLAQRLARRLERRLAIPRADEGPRADLLVGPTGVGKTTTLAKLAALASDLAAEEVALLTADTWRIGAEAQLKSYARLLGVPFERVTSPDELGRLANRLARSRLLIDTAGRSRRDGEALGELLRLREALGRRARVHLVLAAPTREADLRAELERYRSLRPDTLIVTKLDETGSPVELLNLLLDEGTPPLSWVAAGQRVPEDLDLPDPEELASWLLPAEAA